MKYCEKYLTKFFFYFFVMTLQTSYGAFHQRERAWRYKRLTMMKGFISVLDFFVMTLQTSYGAFHQRESVALQTSYDDERVHLSPVALR